MSDTLHFFASSTSRDLKDAREELCHFFSDLGCHDDSQKNGPAGPQGAEDIRRLIGRAYFVICLIGYELGERIDEELAIDGEMTGIIPASYTQWEYVVARKSILENPEQDGWPRQMWVFFHQRKDIGFEFSEDQRIFRENVERKLRGDDRRFFWTFSSKDDLMRQIKDAVRDESGRIYKRLIENQWLRVIREHKEKCQRDWRRSFSDEYPKPDARKFDRSSQIYISNLSFSGLEQAHSHLPQLPYLKQNAFISGALTGTKADARKGSIWHSGIILNDLISELTGGHTIRDLLKPGNVAARRAAPLFFLISGGGVGKSTTLDRLECKINEIEISPDEKIAVKLKVNELAHWLMPGRFGIEFDWRGHHKGPDDALSEFVCNRLALSSDAVRRASSPQGKRLWATAISYGVQAARESGRLVLLIDGVDQAGPELQPILKQLDEPAWRNVAVFVSGRPHAVPAYWEDRQGSMLDARKWCFIEPMEFEEDQVKIYLDASVDDLDKVGESRIFNMVHGQLGSLIYLPRLLSLLRTLEEKDLTDLRTGVSIYLRAIRKLIASSVNSEDFSASLEERAVLRTVDQIVQAMFEVLSAIAYMTLYDAAGFLANNQEVLAPFNNGTNFENLVKRLNCISEPAVSYDRKNVQGVLRLLGGLSTVVGNGIFEDRDVSSDKTLRNVVWANPTIRRFFAAYWLACFAGNAYVSSGGKADSDKFAEHLYFPEDDNNEAEEVNRFLADMPINYIVSYSWVASAKHWYRAHSVQVVETRRWCAEMLYRSWGKMHAIALWEVDDWWDIPYDGLCRRTREAKRHKAIRVDADTPECKAARTAIRTFYEDFAQTRKDIEIHGSPERRNAMRELIQDMWLNAPAGSFKMGALEGAQGLPRKSERYWRNLLEEIVRGDKTPKDQAETCTDPRWFTGLQGKALRANDVDDMEKKVFQPFADDIVANRSEAGITAAKAIALDKITLRWRRRDETPREIEQQVTAFVMKQLPVLHCWYWLFASHHREIACAELSRVGQLELIPHAEEATINPQYKLPPSDHPVIYVSWYDAWAFCQWVNWHDEDTNTHFKCRLPHEPEWEYACRHALSENPAVAPEPVGRELRYWWGNKFYEQEDEGVEEPISSQWAHAVGGPGDTRAPHFAIGNGLGFKDMLGNTWEWCANIYDVRPELEIRADTNSQYSRYEPKGPPPVNPSRTMRGGLWYFLNLLATCSNRYRLTCNDRDYKMGFRMVREAWRPPYL